MARYWCGWWLTATLLLLVRHVARGSEMTFELPDKEVLCFYEEIEVHTKCLLDYQVVAGGHYDVDLNIAGPEGKTIYSTTKSKYDTYEFTAYTTGEYSLCFSNEFSSFTHKKVYMEFIAGDEEPLTEEIGAHQTVLTQLETSVVKIHEALKVVRDYQTHHKMREFKGRSSAEYLNTRVQYWSLGEALAFVFIALMQVFILRRFFTGKRSNI